MKSSLLQSKRTKAQFWSRALRQGIPAAIGMVLGALIVAAVTGKGDWVFTAKLIAGTLLFIPVLGAVRVVFDDYYRGNGDAKK